MSKFKIIIIVSCIFVVCVGLTMLATLFNKIPYTIFWHEPVKTKCCCSDMLDEISEVLSEYGEVQYDKEKDKYLLKTDSATITITFKHGTTLDGWYKVYWAKDYCENPENPYTDSELKDICRLINILSDKSKSKITEENILEFISAPEGKYNMEKVGREKMDSEIYAKMRIMDFWEDEYLIYSASEGGYAYLEITGFLRKCK